MNYTIVCAFVEDSCQIVDYLNKVGGETNFLTFGKNEFSFSVKDEECFINNLNKNKTGIMLLAKTEDKIIGHGISISNGKRSKHVFDISLSVAKHCWGNGIGTNLIQKLESDSVKFGAKKITLYVCANNFSAIKLYEKLGYNQEAVLKKDNFVENEYIDTLIMSKFF